MKELKEELYKCIDKFGLNHPMTIAKSQELDKLIVEQQKLQIGGMYNVQNS